MLDWVSQPDQPSSTGERSLRKTKLERTDEGAAQSADWALTSHRAGDRNIKEIVEALTSIEADDPLLRKPSKSSQETEQVLVEHQQIESPQGGLSGLAGLRTPCILEGERVIAFVDSGASVSFVSAQLVRSKGWRIAPRSGLVQQCLAKEGVPRIGAIEAVILENGGRRIKVDLEVAELAGDKEVIIGVDLFRPLGYSVTGVPFTWPEQAVVLEGQSNPESSASTDQKRIEYPEGVDENGIHPSWHQVLADNANIPVTARCELPGVSVRIDTGNSKPVWVRQYPIPQGRLEAVRQRIKEWDERGWTVEAPPDCPWNIPLLAVDKPSDDGGPPGV